MDDVLDAVRADEKPGNIGRSVARKAIKDAPAQRRVRYTVDDLDYIIFLAGEIADLEMSKHESARDWLINARDGKRQRDSASACRHGSGGAERSKQSPYRAAQNWLPLSRCRRIILKL